MKKKVFSLILLGFLCLQISYAQNGADIVKKMLNSCNEVKTLSYVSHKQERIKGKLIEEKMNVKLVRSPLQLYLKKEFPDKGLEVLYVQGKNNNQAVVNPGSLIPTLKLDPGGSMMRKGQHHTIMASGYDQLASIFNFLYTKYGNKVNENIKYIGSETFNGRDCHKIELNNPTFSYVNYTVQANENLITIAKKNKLSEYMILEKNPTLNDYTDVKAGQKILIPTDYAQRTVIYIDKNWLLPLSVSVYDDKGLFEKYDFLNLKLNPNFAVDEFTEDYSGYGF